MNTSNGETNFGGLGPRRSHQKAAPPPIDYPNLTRRAFKADPESATPAKTVHSNSKALITQEKENQRVKKEMAKIDMMELSDIDSPKWAAAKENYALGSRKRYREIEDAEGSKRKASISDREFSKREG